MTSLKSRQATIKLYIITIKLITQIITTSTNPKHSIARHKTPPKKTVKDLNIYPPGTCILIKNIILRKNCQSANKHLSILTHKYINTYHPHMLKTTHTNNPNTHEKLTTPANYNKTQTAHTDITIKP